jgi:hypothetical protein
MHYVKGYLVRVGVQTFEYDAIEEEIKADKRIRAAYSSYQFLYKLGHNARYKCHRLDPKLVLHPG